MSIGIKSPGKYVQGAGELSNLGRNVKKLGNKFLIVISPNNIKRIGETIEESIKSVEREYTFFEFGGETTKAEINRIMEAAKADGCDAIIGVGGGKAIDAAKAAAENLGGLALVIVPTIASNDAPCSGVAVIYNEEGVVIKALITRRNPDVVLVDTDIIAKSPSRLLKAGIGDALATWFEARACKNSGAKNMARGTCSNTAFMMAKLCYDILMKDGLQAINDLEEKKATQALENVVEANIYLSGVGWESGGLAAAHAVNDSLVNMPETHGMYHGEKVAFGTIVQLVLENAPEKEMNEVLTFMKDIIAKSPSRLLKAGIGDALATWFEARACKNSGAKNMARGTCSNTAFMMAKLCYDILMKDGLQAINDLEEKKATQALENVVEANIYLSGVGWESGGLAAAHAVNDSLVNMPETHGMYHGEKVAFGTIVQLVLENAPEKEMNEVLTFMKAAGLPMTLAQLGVTEIKEDELKKVAEAACVPTQSTKNLRADITPLEVADAIIKADKIGSEF